MKIQKTHFMFLLILLFLAPKATFAICDSEEEKKSDYCKIYYESVQNICKNQDFYKDKASYQENIPIYKTEDYKSPDEYLKDPDFSTIWSTQKEFFPLDGVKRKYRDDQNNIYKCGVLQTQLKSYNLIKQLLKIDKVGILKNSVTNQIASKISLIKDRSSRFKCNLGRDINISKKQVLDQSTFELCRYRYYLEYLKTYYDDIENLVGITETDVQAGEQTNQELNKQFGTNIFKDKVNVDYIAQRKKEALVQINEEINHSYKVFEIAFSAYSEYESFLPVHIALEIVKQDFIILREKLYQTLSPINQVVYKIINAMGFD